MAVVTGQKAVADHFGCDVRNVRHWMQSDDFPQPTGPKSDQYDLDAIATWRAGQPQMLLRDKSSSATNSGKLGEANAALISLLAKTLDVARRAVTLAAGETARIKRIEIEGDGAALAARLERILTD